MTEFIFKNDQYNYLNLYEYCLFSSHQNTRDDPAHILHVATYNIAILPNIK